MLKDRLARAKEIHVRLKDIQVMSLGDTAATATAAMTRELGDGVTTVTESGALTVVLRKRRRALADRRRALLVQARWLRDRPARSASRCSGLGNVGGGVVKLLEDNAAAIEARLGARIAVRAIAVRDPDKAKRVVDVDRALLTTDVDGVDRARPTSTSCAS